MNKIRRFFQGDMPDDDFWSLCEVTAACGVGIAILLVGLALLNWWGAL